MDTVPNVIPPEVKVTRESEANPTPVTAVASPVSGIKVRAVGTAVGAGVGDGVGVNVGIGSVKVRSRS